MFVNFIFMVSYTSLFGYHGSKHRIQFLHEKKSKKKSEVSKTQMQYLHGIIFLTKSILHGY